MTDQIEILISNVPCEPCRFMNSCAWADYGICYKEPVLLELSGLANVASVFEAECDKWGLVGTHPVYSIFFDLVEDIYERLEQPF